MRWKLGAPSCVIPDSVGANCHALAGLVDEVALMLLETRACLDYDEAAVCGMWNNRFGS